MHGMTARRSAHGADADAGRALPLLVWLSPAFPVGAFAYSPRPRMGGRGGRRRATATTLARLARRPARARRRPQRRGAARRAHRAAHAQRRRRAARGRRARRCALAPSRERQLETRAQGDAFLAAVARRLAVPALDALAPRIGAATSPIRSPSASPPPATASRSAPTLRGLPARPSPPTSSRPRVRLGAARPDRRAARARRRWRRRSRAIAARRRDAPTLDDLGGCALPLRLASHAPRNPVHEAVPLMTRDRPTARCASASAARSAPARPR